MILTCLLFYSFSASALEEQVKKKNNSIQKKSPAGGQGFLKKKGTIVGFESA